MDFVSREAVLHMASLVLYVPVIGLALATLRGVRCVESRALRESLRCFLSFTALMSASFVAVQMYWVLDEGFNRLVTLEAVGWLVFDWMNALAYFTFVYSIRLFVQWKPSCRECPIQESCQNPGKCMSGK